MKKIILSTGLLVFALLANAQSNEIKKSGKLEWAKQIGGLSWDGGKSVVVDDWGNVYSTSFFLSAVDLDPGEGVFSVQPEKGNNRYISKLDASGNFLWAKGLGGANQWGSAMAVDGSGNVYSTGYFNNSEGMEDFDPDIKKTCYLKHSGNDDIFISKLDASGNFVWARSIGGNGMDWGASVSVDASGNSYIIGQFGGTVDFDPDSLSTHQLTSAGSSDIFILKLNASGNFVWAGNMGGDLTDQGISIKLDRKGNIYLSGYFNGKADFDPDLLKTFYLSTSQDQGESNAFISKLDADGNFVWAKSFKGNAGSYAASIEVDLSGNVYASGAFRETVDFDPDSLSSFYLKSSGSHDIFISKLNSSGNFLWAKSAGDVSTDDSRSIALDKSGNVYVCGVFKGTVDFDAGTGINELVSAGENDLFILKLDRRGNFVWVKKIGGQSLDQAISIAVDSWNNVYGIGTFYSTIDFEGFGEAGSFTSKGADDIFIFKLSQDTCSNMTLLIDSLRNTSCSNSTGYISAQALNGHPPYKYLWNTVPETKEPKVNIVSNGIYSLIVTDQNGCSRGTSVIMSGSQAQGLDLTANLTAERFVPGQQSIVWIDGANEKCTPAQGNLSIVLNKNLIYNNASPGPDNISGDTLIWNFKDFTSDSKPIKPVLNVTTRTDVKVGDSTCFDLAIGILKEDKDSLKKKKRYCFPIRFSRDPNIKSVYPVGACEPGYVLKNKPLTYTVQFQNNGNTEAINIYILDTLDAHLDMKSFRLLGFSHKEPIVELLPDRVLKFSFNNINLPDSLSNEKGSHGHVVFEIMPDINASNGTIVKGQAGIYFDYNEPVFTNEVKNSLTNSIPVCFFGIDKPRFLKPINIYPNPNTGNFTIEIDNPETNASIEVYNLAGKMVEQVEKLGKVTLLDLDLSAGIYLVRVKNGGMVYNQKVVINR